MQERFKGNDPINVISLDNFDIKQIPDSFEMNSNETLPLQDCDKIKNIVELAHLDDFQYHEDLVREVDESAYLEILEEFRNIKKSNTSQKEILSRNYIAELNNEQKEAFRGIVRTDEKNILLIGKPGVGNF